MANEAGGALVVLILFYALLVVLLPIAIFVLIIYGIYRLCTKKKKQPNIVIAHSPHPAGPGYVSPQPQQYAVASPVV